MRPTLFGISSDDIMESHRTANEEIRYYHILQCVVYRMFYGVQMLGMRLPIVWNQSNAQSFGINQMSKSHQSSWPILLIAYLSLTLRNCTPTTFSFTSAVCLLACQNLERCSSFRNNWYGSLCNNWEGVVESMILIGSRRCYYV